METQAASPAAKSPGMLVGSVDVRPDPAHHVVLGGSDRDRLDDGVDPGEVPGDIADLLEPALDLLPAEMHQLEVTGPIGEAPAFQHLGGDRPRDDVPRGQLEDLGSVLDS